MQKLSIDFFPLYTYAPVAFHEAFWIFMRLAAARNLILEGA